MKKFFIFILILAALAIIMKLTLPSQEKHQQVAAEKIAEILKDQISDVEGMDELFEEYGLDANMVANFAAAQLQIYDCFIYNAGVFSYDGKSYPLTIGLFNHVFVTTDYIDEIQKVNSKMEKIKNKLD